MQSLRKTTANARKLEQLASKLGRIKFNRGKEPTWVSEQFPHLCPISIPHHGGNIDLKLGTKNSILNDLEEDLLEWEDFLSDD